MSLHDFLTCFISTYMFLHVSTYFLQDSKIVFKILVCVVMVQVSYIPRCRVMFDLPFGPRLCKSSPYTLVCNLYLVPG